jgi:drug/metabolite transporter (DMT)-like permease
MLQVGGQVAAGFSGLRDSFLNPFTIISYGCLVSRGLIWVIILKRINLTTAYPFTGLVYLLILPLSAFIFGDNISWQKAAGAVLIFGGIIFTSIGARLRRQREQLK